MRERALLTPKEPKAWNRHISSIPLYAACLLLAYFSVSAAVWWRGAVVYPYALENGEGWVLASAVELSEGRSPYGTLEDYPLTVGNYPPLYLAANAVAIRLRGFSPLYGRAISLAAWLLGVMMLMAAARKVGASWSASLVGGLFALAVPGMRFAAVQARVDLLAASFAFAGILWLLFSDRHSGVVGPAACFSLALATKHSMVAAPAAALLWLLWHDRQRFARLFLWTAGLTALWVAVCAIIFGKAFFLNLGPYTMAIPWEWRNLERMWRMALGLWYLPSLVATVVFAAWALPKGDKRDRLVALYGLTAAGTIALVAKEGSSILYLVEFTLAGSLCLACAVSLTVEVFRFKSVGFRFGIALVLALSLFFLQISVRDYPITQRVEEARRAWKADWEGQKKRDELMVTVIRRAKGPVLAEEPIYLLAAGKRVLLNPFVMKWMARQGYWEEKRLIRDIARHHFELIQLNGFAVPPAGRPLRGPERSLQALTRARFSPEVLRAVDLWYQVIRPLRDYPLGKIYAPKGAF